MIKKTKAHEAVFSAYLKLRWPAGLQGQEVQAAEQKARQENPNGLSRLAHLVPELAPDQMTLARLLAEAAILSRQFDFTPPSVLRKVHELHALIGGHPMHAGLEKALQPYVERDAGKRHDQRDDAIRFAMHAALEADVLATSRNGAPSASIIVSDSLRRWHLDDITPASVAGIWRGRANKGSRER